MMLWPKEEACPLCYKRCFAVGWGGKDRPKGSGEDESQHGWGVWWQEVYDVIHGPEKSGRRQGSNRQQCSRTSE